MRRAGLRTRFRRRGTQLLLARRVFVAGLAAVSVSAGGCGSPPSPHGSTSNPSSDWVDQPISFMSDGVRIYATYRHPRKESGERPAALLIAGSGPTDRNGNTPETIGTVGTLETLADWLSSDGIASLRYDKLGSGRTGLPSAEPLTNVSTFSVYQDEAEKAYTVMSGLRGVDHERLMVFGHSEGALFALMLAAQPNGNAPEVYAIGLVEPLSQPYLDAISGQISRELASMQAAGKMSVAQVDQIQSALKSTVASIRSTGRAPRNLSPLLAKVFTPSATAFLADADRHDPTAIARDLKPHMPVFVTCSNSDLQVPCDDVSTLVAALQSAAADVDFIRLSGVDHVLKEDSSGSPLNYGLPLPFSSQAEASLRDFLNPVSR